MRKKWDVLIIVFSLYNCIELPMEIAYAWRETHDKYHITERLNNVIDVLFLHRYFHELSYDVLQFKDRGRNYRKGKDSKELFDSSFYH